MARFSDEIFVITGLSSGIGLAGAKRIVEEREGHDDRTPCAKTGTAALYKTMVPKADGAV
ncbi:hypothetical protein H1224_07620 [Pectobacterium aroidearum]|uniref:hypothetical protein n=1 Tax=Pectobacterium aroidearum TaxID=1201031 RepID=UPI0015F51023|nr:hypothetical protein [Pectobacterium aroidearum]MBA5600931.1 hypothetical protein [Pectobacterium aroidearum]